MTVNEGDIDVLQTQVATNVTDIDNLDNRVTVNEGDIVNLDNRVSVVEGDVTDLQTQVAVNVTDIDNLDNRVTSNTTNIANVDARVTTNTSNITQVQQALANVPVTYASDTDPTVRSDTPTDTVALVAASGGAATLTNVAAGNVAAGSTDAVNGSQLAATNANVAANRTDIDQNTADIATINSNIAGSTVVAVQYSNADTPTVSNGGTITNDVTLVGADLTQPVGLHNVRAGTAATDAVNVGQLQTGLANALAGARSYTDQRFDTLSTRVDGLSFDLAELRDDAFSGTASAMAVAGIPQTMEAGRAMVGGAVGHYRGQTAFALGFSTTFSDGSGVLKAGGTLDTDGHGGFSAGAGFSF